MSFEDAVQEASYIFYLMRSRYEKRQEEKNERQYMAIYKVFWNRHFIDLTKKNDKQKRFQSISSLKPDNADKDFNFEEFIFGIGDLNIETLILISRQVDKDKDLKALIELLGTVEGEELEELRNNIKFSHSQKDVKGNCFLCKKLNLNSTKRDLLSDLRSLLSY